MKSNNSDLSKQPPQTDTPEAHNVPQAPVQDNHLSTTISLDHWLRLLVVTATVLLLLTEVWVSVHLLGMIGHTLLVFSLGGLLAYAIEPLIDRARGVGPSGGPLRSRSKTTLLVFGAFILLTSTVGLLLSAPLSKQITILVTDHRIYEASAHDKLHQWDDWLAAKNIKLNLETYLNNPPPNVKSWGEAISGHVLATLGHAGKAVVEAFIVGLIALYFLIYCNEMREGVQRHLPGRLAPYAKFWMDDTNLILGGFVRGQLALACSIGAMAAVLCLVMGVKLWLLIGLFVVVAALIPVIGPFIGAIPAVAAALVSPNAHFTPAVRVIILVAAFGVINEIGSKILYPKLVGAALGLHEVLVLFILFAGVEVAGLTGVLFAAPLTALCYVSLGQIYRLWQGLPPKSIAANTTVSPEPSGA